MILASNFSGLSWVFIAIPGAFLGLALLSFIPAAYGHWSTIILAAPPIALGIVFGSMVLFSSPRVNPGLCCVVITPPVLGILAMGVWSERRKRDRE